MKVALKELMDKLGVGRVLNPYETNPWFYVDDEEGITASAEVLVNGDGDEVRAELQFMYEPTRPNKPPVEQVILLRAKPQMRLQGLWTTTDLWVERIDFSGKVYGWEEKGCNFFRACVRDLKANRLPDIELLIARELGAREVWGGGNGDSSSKAPKIKSQQLLYDMKNKGRGF